MIWQATRRRRATCSTNGIRKLAALRHTTIAGGFARPTWAGLLVSLAASFAFFFGPLSIRCVYSRSQTNTKSAKEACGRVNETAAVSRPLAFVASPRRDGGYPGRARLSSVVFYVHSTRKTASGLSHLTGNEKLGQGNLQPNAMELTSVRNFPVSGTSSRLKCT